jgi:NTE family protein
MNSAKDAVLAKPESGMALALSGGGYRAMLFHLGALWRLNVAGYLPKLVRISSVSGGSIIAGVLGLAWPRLQFDDQGRASAFEQEVAAPIHRLAGKTIDRGAIFWGLLGPGKASNYIIRAYRNHLFGTATLQDLPGTEGPRFVFNATNLQSGVLWRFSKPFARDFRVGEIPNPEIPLAVAVAASSAFPPFLSPVVLRFKASDYTPGSGHDLQSPPYTTKVFLTDGGVYDNFGLETIWKRYTTILVSDGGGRMTAEKSPWSIWPFQIYRVLNLIDNQVRSLRRAYLIDSYNLPGDDRNRRQGAYWGISTDITEYKVSDAMKCPIEQTHRLARVPTRLAALNQVLQRRLVNWGFAVCDAALRKYVAPDLPAPSGYPYPEAGIG